MIKKMINKINKDAFIEFVGSMATIIIVTIFYDLLIEPKTGFFELISVLIAASLYLKTRRAKTLENKIEKLIDLYIKDHNKSDEQIAREVFNDKKKGKN